MASCHNLIPEFEFTRAEIDQTLKNGGLLSLEIEISLRCNFRCPYCYVPDKSFPDNEFSKKEIYDVILQAKDMGAKKIIILGGEPSIHPHILEIIRFMKQEDLEVEMFTNGSGISKDFALQLFENDVRVVLKMNTFDKELQDKLTGIKGSYLIIRNALKNLKQAGYPSNDKFLAVSTVICKQNFDEMPDMWKWLRDQNIIPYLEIITPQENARQNEWLNVDPRSLHELFARIAELDRTRYGHVWSPQPPLVGIKCLRHQFSCLVKSQGDVMPCVGVTIPIGNVRRQKLKDIIRQSEVMNDLRNFRRTIKGPCRACEKAETCYGCRGAAYQLTGDYLASDPLCWKNIDRQDEILRLPLAVDEIIPHKPPMRLVDTLVKVGERSADVAVTISDDMPFTEKNGKVDESAYIELMAQSIAALNGFKNIDLTTSAAEGFLIGAKRIEILGTARVGDRLNISVCKFARYGDFGIIKGTVSRDNDIIAQGEIKIWHKTANSQRQA